MKYWSLFILFGILLMTGCNPGDQSGIIQDLELQQVKLMRWNFPLPRTHTGILIGNGVQGLMVWGGGNQLNITVGRSGFWDHRGEKDFLTQTTYGEVKNLLLRGDMQGLRRVFSMDEKAEEGMPSRPYQIGGGRIEIIFPEGWKVSQGILDLTNATLEVLVSNPSGTMEIIRIREAVFEESASITFPSHLTSQLEINLVPSWEHVQQRLEPYGVRPPQFWKEEQAGREIIGFTQLLPEDDPLAVAYEFKDNQLILYSALGKNPVEQVVNLSSSFSLLERRTARINWWQQYWEDVPSITLPDPVLQEILDYGLYKQAICTPPQGMACSLQGPFNEEYQLPPWSNDYHFNINIEMIYLPALATNRGDHLMPLWNMIKAWLPVLRENGEVFFERDGALMLPHAVNDRGRVVGTFWTGTIDHACTAWMAQLAWLHYRYTMDTTILEEIAWPLLKGAFEGYWAMLEEVNDGKGGKIYELPVSVSPEFKGSREDAWGKNASFQLAALHMISRILPEAARALDMEIDPRWRDVDERTPDYAIVNGPVSLESPERKVERIALWEGMDLIESHRHHSHMAAIYPFNTVDPLDPTHGSIVRSTYHQWIRQGAGVWSGWCVPWASILHNRYREPEAAVSWLHYWYRNFVNEGRGTLHNAAFGGMSNISSPGWHNIHDITQNREVMQLDAGFGALSAILDLLVHTNQGTVYVLRKIHRDWKEFEFDGIAVEGAFLIGAKVKGGVTQEITVESKAGGKLRLAHGLGEKYLLDGAEMEGMILERTYETGERITLSRSD